MPEKSSNFLRHLLGQMAEQGRGLIEWARRPAATRSLTETPLAELVRLLLSTRGEASGVVIAREIMTRYAALPKPERLGFLAVLAREFSADPARIREAYEAYEREPGEDNLYRLGQAVEPARQDALRRLNLAPGNTLGLVRMREDLLEADVRDPALRGLDRDFVHLFASWFNRGFLMVRRIDWSSPAHILEKIIRYEAVHEIRSWEDLRRRIDPPDRRCYAFFHPALVDEPLIFVEVALMSDMPAAIEPILAEKRDPLSPEMATCAVFYSISNCQKGLSAISFGNFLIKQVVEELRRDLPGLSRFVTLSPVPGFRVFVERERQDPASIYLDAADRALLADYESEGADAHDLAAFSAMTERLLARYFLEARTPNGRVIDPVARFHLGNGARLERLNPLADFSQKGWRDSYAAMVNYLYDLDQIEENHEKYAIRGLVAASASVQEAALPARGRSRARAS
ncbi:MAG: malonyl-CoA decarboxylase [Rhizobiales bacterium]|nr:malonyl-CoA decarboxylase [Hyphomicrobiales bacterium]